MHLAIGFSVPWMVSWWAYLPFIGQFAPERSAEWALLLFDLAVACAAWTLAREKCRATPLWTDAPPPRPQPPRDHSSSSPPGPSTETAEEHGSRGQK
jgi:hypothetical protein